MRFLTDTKLRQTLYRLYFALFQAKQECPKDFHFGKLTTIQTAIMGIEGVGWRVVGITNEALELLATQDFRKNKLPGRLCRGHIKDRNSTARTLFDRERPAGIDEFFQLFIENDKTVIMLVEQNKKSESVLKFIPIDNPAGELFPNAKLVAWKHRTKERDFLRELHSKQGAKQ